MLSLSLISSCYYCLFVTLFSYKYDSYRLTVAVVVIFSIKSTVFLWVQPICSKKSRELVVVSPWWWRFVRACKAPGLSSQSSKLCGAWPHYWQLRWTESQGDYWAVCVALFNVRRSTSHDWTELNCEPASWTSQRMLSNQSVHGARTDRAPPDLVSLQPIKSWRAWPVNADCLPILLSISVFLIFSFSVFPLFSCWFRAVD